MKKTTTTGADDVNKSRKDTAYTRLQNKEKLNEYTRLRNKEGALSYMAADRVRHLDAVIRLWAKRVDHLAKSLACFEAEAERHKAGLFGAYDTEDHRATSAEWCEARHEQIKRDLEEAEAQLFAIREERAVELMQEAKHDSARSFYDLHTWVLKDREKECE